MGRPYHFFLETVTRLLNVITMPEDMVLLGTIMIPHEAHAAALLNSSLGRVSGLAEVATMCAPHVFGYMLMGVSACPMNVRGFPLRADRKY